MSHLKLRRRKMFDLIGQLATFTVPYLWWVFVCNFGCEDFPVFGTTIVANTIWVFISIIIHLGVMGRRWISTCRKILCITYLCVIVIALVVWSTEGRTTMGLPPSIIITFIIPILGLPYFVISIYELRAISRLNTINTNEFQ